MPWGTRSSKKPDSIMDQINAVIYQPYGVLLEKDELEYQRDVVKSQSDAVMDQAKGSLHQPDVAKHQTGFVVEPGSVMLKRDFHAHPSGFVRLQPGNVKDIPSVMIF